MTVLAYSEDPVAAAKVVDALPRTTRSLLSLAGAMGATPLDEAGSQGRGQHAVARGADRFRRGVIGAPGGNLVAAIGAPAANIAAILTTLEEREAA
jgi:large subunit ribosomal protein L10